MKTIIGTWRLLSLELRKETGEVIFPLGKEVKGLLLYQNDGFMSGIISGEGRPNVSVPAAVGIPDAERLAISKNFIAYSGRYSIDNDKIVHSVEVSFVPNLMGNSSHIGTFSLIGDNLSIKSKQLSKKNKNYLIVIWERIKC